MYCMYVLVQRYRETERGFLKDPFLSSLSLQKGKKKKKGGKVCDELSSLVYLTHKVASLKTHGMS